MFWAAKSPDCTLDPAGGQIISADDEIAVRTSNSGGAKDDRQAIYFTARQTQSPAATDSKSIYLSVQCPPSLLV